MITESEKSRVKPEAKQILAILNKWITYNKSNPNAKKYKLHDFVIPLKH